MIKRERSTYLKCNSVVAVLLLSLSNVAFSQESAYADLDSCTKNEQVKNTVKGAAVGALSGLGAAFLSGNKDKAGKAALIGAAAGGAVGFATAYYSAVDKCYKSNPSWIPESKLARDPAKSYKDVVKENHYQAKEGVKVQFKQVDVASTVKAGTSLPISSTFDVLTPDGAETPVVIERKLFVIDQGKENPVPFPDAKAGQATVVEAGRNISKVQLPIPADSTPGTVYRLDMSVATAGKTPDMVSRSFTVQ
jgi:hypothetical protein